MTDVLCTTASCLEEVRRDCEDRYGVEVRHCTAKDVSKQKTHFNQGNIRRCYSPFMLKSCFCNVVLKQTMSLLALSSKVALEPRLPRGPRLLRPLHLPKALPHQGVGAQQHHRDCLRRHRSIGDVHSILLLYNVNCYKIVFGRSCSFSQPSTS